MQTICNLENIHIQIKNEGLQLLVVSYGGSCTNVFVNYLEQNNYKCKTDCWHKILCHCPKYIECDIPIIYIYDNPIKSFMSMKNRTIGLWNVNQQKLSNNKNEVLSDENLLKLMINQFNNWTNIRRPNVLIIQSNELFQNTIVNKLNCFLKTNINYFPIEYKKPSTDINNIKNTELVHLFEKYKYEIDTINNFNIPIHNN